MANSPPADPADPPNSALSAAPDGEPGSAASPPARLGPVGIVFGRTSESGRFDDQLGAPVTIRGAGFAIRQGGLNGRPGRDNRVGAKRPRKRSERSKHLVAVIDRLGSWRPDSRRRLTADCGMVRFCWPIG